METRLVQIRRQLGLKQEDLARVLDCSPENISMIERGKSSLSERNKKCLIKKFNLNPEWFENSAEPMFMSDGDAAFVAENAGTAAAPMPDSANIPLFDMAGIAGLASLLEYTAASRGAKRGRGRKSSAEKSFEPVGRIGIPGLPACDGALRVAGDGMSPIVGSGDIVLYSRLESPDEIFWGEMYLVSVESSAGEYVAVRYLRKSKNDGRAVLAGANPQFAETEVELSKIRAIALVKATIRVAVSR
uniref:Putative peptidase S24/LexA repressor family protein n=1 Tax=termite gut metagenome TaxID=433724 RepID=S0DE17_9ZZZZ